jgi:hypothetical protein
MLINKLFPLRLLSDGFRVVDKQAEFHLNRVCDDCYSPVNVPSGSRSGKPILE